MLTSMARPLIAPVLSFAFKNLETVPQAWVRAHKTATHLDFSHNHISDCAFLGGFDRIEFLNLDDNQLTAHSSLPVMPYLHTLTVNKNNIQNLHLWLATVGSCVPNVRHLSMLANEACPNFFNGGTAQQYKEYRLLVISRLPQLAMLDSSVVSADERANAHRLFGSVPRTVSTSDAIAVESRRYCSVGRKGG